MSLVFRTFSFLAGISLVLALAGDSFAQRKGGKKNARPHLVESVAVENLPLSFETVRTGTLAARKSVRIFNQEEGRIDSISVREGDRVKAGTLLVRLDRRLLTAELAKAAAKRRQVEGTLKRVRELSRRKVTTQERLDQSEMELSVAKAEENLIRTRLDYTRIRAPFDGIVTERKAEPGDIAPRHTHLMTLIDTKSLFTKVSVSELVIPRLRNGDAVSVIIDALGAQASTGRIGRIHPIVDPRTRQGTIEVELDPVPPGAVAGQLCRVRLKTPEANRLVIPFAALRRDKKGEFAFVVAKGKALVKRVRTGLRLEHRIEILEGLAEGDKVVVRGFLDLRAGKKVSVVNGQPSSKPGPKGKPKAKPKPGEGT